MTFIYVIKNEIVKFKHLGNEALPLFGFGKSFWQFTTGDALKFLTYDFRFGCH